VGLLCGEGVPAGEGVRVKTAVSGIVEGRMTTGVGVGVLNGAGVRYASVVDSAWETR